MRSIRLGTAFTFRSHEYGPPFRSAGQGGSTREAPHSNEIARTRNRPATHGYEPLVPAARRVDSSTFRSDRAHRPRCMTEQVAERWPHLAPRSSIRVPN